MHDIREVASEYFSRPDPEKYLKAAAHGFAVLLMVGCLFLGFVMFLKAYKIVSHGERVSGIVVDIKISTTSNRRQYAHPVIKFKTIEGKEIEFTATSPSLFVKTAKGDEVPIVYNKNRPQEAEIDSFYDLWLFPLAIFGVALVGLTIFLSEYIKLDRAFGERKTSGGRNVKTRPAKSVDPEIAELNRLADEEQMARFARTRKK